MPSNVGYWWQSRIYSEFILKLEDSVVYLLNTGCEWSVLDPCVVLTSKEKKTGKLIADRIFMCGLADTFTSCQYYMDFTKQQHSGCVIVSSPFCLSGLDCGLLTYLLRNLYFRLVEIVFILVVSGFVLIHIEKNCHGTEQLLWRSTVAEAAARTGTHAGLTTGLVAGCNKEVRVGFMHSAGFWFPVSFMVHFRWKLETVCSCMCVYGWETTHLPIDHRSFASLNRLFRVEPVFTSSN